MRIQKFITAVAERYNVESDTAIAEIVGLTQPAISQYRAGKRFPDNEACLKIAQALDMADPMPIIMAADIDRAEHKGQRSLWEVFSKRMAPAADPASLAALAVAVGSSVTKFVTSPALQASIDAVLKAKDFVLC
ncbi:Cro/Cl family transcriptional regulator [Cupriavidus pauculus]